MYIYTSMPPYVCTKMKLAIFTQTSSIKSFGDDYHIIFQPCTVTAHWHKGTTFMIQFDETVIARDKAFDAR